MQSPSLNNSIEHLSRLFHGERNEYQLHPHRDWAILLLVFFVVIASVLLWSVYLFQGVSSGDLFAPTPGLIQSTHTIDRTRLDSTLQEFTKRREQASLFSEKPALVDPSE